MKMIKTLKVKLVSVIMLIVTVMLAVIFGLVLFFTKTSSEQESIRAMRLAAEEAFRPNRHLNNISHDTMIPFISMQTDRNGNITAYGQGYYEGSDFSFLKELAEKAMEFNSESGIINEYKLRFLRNETPMGYTLIFSDTSREDSMMESLVKSCLLIGGASFVLFFALSVLLANWAVKPVAKAWEQQKQFIADASHELKTPLTVIMTNGELLSDTLTEQSGKQFSANILEMSKRMRRLVEGLLELARLDGGGAAVQHEQIDLSRLAEDAILPFEPLFFEKGRQLSSEIEGNVPVKGDKTKLNRVVDILLDNALKYSDEGSEIKLRLYRQGARCVLAVSSRGEEISKEECKNIFKRFYRMDKSRSDGQSYGLGLSIAESIVKEHRGRIRAESENGVNTFFVELGVSS